MKKYPIIVFLLFLYLTPFSLVFGQESSEEFRKKYILESKERFPEAKQDFFDINQKFEVIANVRLLKKEKIEELKTSAKKNKTLYRICNFEV